MNESAGCGQPAAAGTGPVTPMLLLSGKPPRQPPAQRSMSNWSGRPWLIVMIRSGRWAAALGAVDGGLPEVLAGRGHQLARGGRGPGRAQLGGEVADLWVEAGLADQRRADGGAAGRHGRGQPLLLDREFGVGVEALGGR